MPSVMANRLKLVESALHLPDSYYEISGLYSHCDAQPSQAGFFQAFIDLMPPIRQPEPWCHRSDHDDRSGCQRYKAVPWGLGVGGRGWWSPRRRPRRCSPLLRPWR